MKLWRSTDPPEPPVGDAGQFFGRTAEEALSRAAAALGPSAELRCWKTRRGGVGGFFATEVYVAGSTPPRGAGADSGRQRRASSDQATGVDERAARLSADPDPDQTPSPFPPDSSPDPLAELVDGTTDEVSLQHSVIPSAAFRALLAEAEAALTQDPALPQRAVPADPPQPLPGERSHDAPPAPEPALAPGPAAAPRSPAPDTGGSPVARPLPVPTAGPSAVAAQAQGPERIPDLRARLRALGMPDAYLPRGPRPSLNALARALGTLPCAPPLTARDGAVVVVVGPQLLADRTADLLLGPLGLGRRGIVRCAAETDGPEGGATTRASAVKVSVGVRVARRRATRQTSVVAVRATLSAEDSSFCADLIDCLRPDYVLAAAEGSAKRTDVTHWLERLGAVDALAVWGLESTQTPAELLGAAPIAYADGSSCSAISWTVALLARVLGHPA